MKKTMLIKAVLLLTVSIFALSGCNKYKDIKIKAKKIESCKVDGFKAVDLGLAITVDNPAGKLQILELYGYVKHSGKVIGKVDVAPFILRPRTTDVYHLDMRAGFVEEFGIRDVLGFVKLKDVLMAVKKKDFLSLINCDFVDELTVDVSAVGKIAGIKVKKTYQDVPLKKLLKK